MLSDLREENIALQKQISEADENLNKVKRQNQQVYYYTFIYISLFFYFFKGHKKRKS